MSRQATQTLPPTPGAPDAGGGVGRSPYLDASLDKAHKLAVSQHHGGVSSEHLLFALTEDVEALVVLGASTVSIERLRADITTHLAQLPHDTPPGKAIMPTADLLKVLKLAAMAAQQSARRQIDGAIVLAAIIGDASTPSAGLLKAHGLTFNEVIRVLQRAAPPALPTVPAGPAALAPPVAPPVAEAAAPAPKAQVANVTSARVAQAGASTDELLATVRARLQEAAPAAPASRKIEKPAVQAENGQPAKTEPQDGAIKPAGETAEVVPAPKALMPPVAAEAVRAAEVEPKVAATVPLEAPEQLAMPAQPSAVGPRTPDDLKPPLMPTKRAIADVAPGSLMAMTAAAARAAQAPSPPVSPMAGQSGETSAVQGLQPPRRMAPPPLPPSAAAAAPQPATSAQVRVPPIPPATVDMRALAGLLPKRMRNGRTEVIEITVPRRALEIPATPGHRWPPLRVASLRLRVVEDKAFVELASPESLWISPPRVHQGADDATWRWRVTPRVDGRFKIALSGATRIVGSEGISGEIPLGEEIVEIDVARRGSRRGLVGLLLFGNLLAVGLLAMVMSGKASEMILGGLKAVRGLWGG